MRGWNAFGSASSVVIADGRVDGRKSASGCCRGRGGRWNGPDDILTASIGDEEDTTILAPGWLHVPVDALGQRSLTGAVDTDHPDISLSGPICDGTGVVDGAVADQFAVRRPVGMHDRGIAGSDDLGRVRTFALTEINRPDAEELTATLSSTLEKQGRTTAIGTPLGKQSVTDIGSGAGRVHSIAPDLPAAASTVSAAVGEFGTVGRKAGVQLVV